MHALTFRQRLIILAIALPILLIGGYSYLWFQKARQLETMVSKAISDINTMPSPLGQKITLGSHKITGYPWSWTIELQDIQATFLSIAGMASPGTAPSTNTLNISSLALEYSIFGQAFHLFLPTHSNFASTYLNQPYTVEYNFSSPPELTLDLTYSIGDIINVLFKKDIHYPAYMNRWQSLSYHHDDMNVKWKEKNADILSTKQWDVNISNYPTKDGSKSLSLAMNTKEWSSNPATFKGIKEVWDKLNNPWIVSNQPYINQLIQTSEQIAKVSGSTSFNFNATVNLPPEGTKASSFPFFPSSVNIQQLKLKNNLSEFSSTGSVQQSNTGMPNVNMMITISNIDEFLTETLTYLNFMSIQNWLNASLYPNPFFAPAPAPSLYSPLDASKAKTLLEQYGTYKDKNLTISIASTPQGKVMIGKYDFDTLLKSLASTFPEKMQPQIAPMPQGSFGGRIMINPDGSSAVTTYGTSSNGIYPPMDMPVPAPTQTQPGQPPQQ